MRRSSTGGETAPELLRFARLRSSPDPACSILDGRTSGSGPAGGAEAAIAPESCVGSDEQRQAMVVDGGLLDPAGEARERPSSSSRSWVTPGLRVLVRCQHEHLGIAAAAPELRGHQVTG
jgi:hypothetical protein